MEVVDEWDNPDVMDALTDNERKDLHNRIDLGGSSEDEKDKEEQEKEDQEDIPNEEEVEYLEEIRPHLEERQARIDAEAAKRARLDLEAQNQAKTLKKETIRGQMWYQGKGVVNFVVSLPGSVMIRWEKPLHNPEREGKSGKVAARMFFTKFRDGNDFAQFFQKTNTKDRCFHLVFHDIDQSYHIFFDGKIESRPDCRSTCLAFNSWMRSERCTQRWRQLSEHYQDVFVSHPGSHKERL